MAFCARNLMLLKNNPSQLYLNLSYLSKYSSLRVGLQAPSFLRLRYFSSRNSELHAPAKSYGDRNSAKKTSIPYDVDLNVPENVLLYTDGNRQSTFGVLSIYGCAAFAMLTFIGDSIRVTIKDKSDSVVTQNDQPKWWQWWKRVNVNITTVKNAICVLCILIGFVIFLGCQLYPLRIITSIWLLSGGKMVSVSTYKPLARVRTMKYPLNHISCESDPTSAGHYIHLRLKGKYSYFLIDKKKGKFYNDNIFKGSVGLKREF